MFLKATLTHISRHLQGISQYAQPTCVPHSWNLTTKHSRCPIKLLNEKPLALHNFNLGNGFPKHSISLPSVKVLDYPLPHIRCAWIFLPHLTALSKKTPFCRLPAVLNVTQQSMIYPKTRFTGCFGFICFFYSSSSFIQYPPDVSPSWRNLTVVERAKTKTGCQSQLPL